MPRPDVYKRQVSGLGLALVRALAARGDQVMAADLADAAPEGVLPAGVTYRQLDVRSDADWAVSYTHLDVYKRQVDPHPAQPDAA